MNKIGICFPQRDFFELKYEDFKNYILKFKNCGIYSIDFYTDFITDYQNNIDELLEFLNVNNIIVTFHYANKNKIEVNSESEKREELEIYKKEIETLRNRLIAANMNYNTTIVFHAFDYYNESEKYKKINYFIEIFSDLCDYAKEYNFEILLETLSKNHPKGNHIGDDIDELEFIINNINKTNFGICWDMGHTRTNFIENNFNKYLTNNILSKIKFAHIHNFYIQDNIIKIDHLPLTNVELLKDEIKFLYNKGYKGIYLNETNIENLKENFLIYKESIKNLNSILNNISL